MGKVNTYRDLKIWGKSMNMVTHIYHLTREFPNNEQFGQTSQIRRSAVSIPSNIAEGFGRQTQKEFAYFLEKENF